MTNHVCSVRMHRYGVGSKGASYLGLSDIVKLFCDLKLNYNLVVCSMPNLIELCHSLAYKKCFSI